MKQTRKIFVLNDYSRVEEKILLHELKFKALVVFYSKEVTEDELTNVFGNNKSALCISCKLPKCYEKKSIVCNNLNFDESIIKQFEDFAISHNCDIGDHNINPIVLDYLVPLLQKIVLIVNFLMVFLVIIIPFCILVQTFL